GWAWGGGGGGARGRRGLGEWVRCQALAALSASAAAPATRRRRGGSDQPQLAYEVLDDLAFESGTARGEVEDVGRGVEHRADILLPCPSRSRRRVLSWRRGLTRPPATA